MGSEKVTFAPAPASADDRIVDDPPNTSSPGRGADLEPLVKWAGGKRRIAKRIVDLFPAEFLAYHEPFCGGAAVFCEAFNRCVLADKVVYLSDLCSPLVTLYKTVENASTVEPLHQMLDMLATEYADDKDSHLGGVGDHQADHYARVRAQFNTYVRGQSGATVSIAAWFLYLNRTSFNGLWRVNSRGEYNVPFGQRARFVHPDRDQLEAWHRALRTALISCSEWEDQMPMVCGGDVLYLDPPYDVDEGSAQFTKYAGAFGWGDQVRLANAARDVALRGATVIASNRATPRCLELWRGLGFEVELISVRHNIGAKADRRRSVGEFIARSKT